MIIYSRYASWLLMFYLVVLCKYINTDKDKKGQGNINKKLTYPADKVDKSMCRDDQPEYLAPVKEIMEKMAKELGYGDYDICQNLPWYQIHRNLEVILGPDNDTKYLVAECMDRTVNLTHLIGDIHKMDLAAGFFRQLKEKTAKELTELNSANHNYSMNILLQMKKEAIKGKKRIDKDYIKELRQNLTIFINSAPANMRPGDPAKNDLIGCHFDPNVILYAGDRILTPGSKELAKVYESRMVSYGETLKEKNVASSDLVPTTHTMQPPTAPMATVKSFIHTKPIEIRKRKVKKSVTMRENRVTNSPNTSNYSMNVKTINNIPTPYLAPTKRTSLQQTPTTSPMLISIQKQIKNWENRIT